VATFVLIPGAGTDPRVYDATIEALDALGHGGLAPALSLDDANAVPSDHADAAVSALPADGELIVVAQSLGAFAGSLVAARAPVAQLVLVAPMIPRPGETAGEWGASTGHEEAIADLLERHGPMSSWGPDAIAEVFLHDVDPGVARDNERYQGTPGEGMFGEPLAPRELARCADPRACSHRGPALPARVPAPCRPRAPRARDRRDPWRPPAAALAAPRAHRASHRAGPTRTGRRVMKLSRSLPARIRRPAVLLDRCAAHEPNATRT
jgi:hypothetical protein